MAFSSVMVHIHIDYRAHRCIHLNIHAIENLNIEINDLWSILSNRLECLQLCYIDCTSHFSFWGSCFFFSSSIRTQINFIWFFIFYFQFDLISFFFVVFSLFFIRFLSGCFFFVFAKSLFLLQIITISSTLNSSTRRFYSHLLDLSWNISILLPFFVRMSLILIRAWEYKFSLRSRSSLHILMGLLHVFSHDTLSLSLSLSLILILFYLTDYCLH